MTTPLSHADQPADAELISAVRGGDVDAYGELFERHSAAALRLARQLDRSDADDLVSEAFVKVLRVLQGGGGPDVAFRAYLLTAVRRVHVDRIRAASKVKPTDDMTPFDPGVPFEDPAVAAFDNAAAAAAFASLPERWQLVLWHTEVERQKPADVAPLLGMSANSVSALAYRAREGLRQAYLNQHAQELEGDLCRWTHQHLGAYVRGGASRRDATKVEAHLQECRPCTAVYLELTELNNNLAGIIGPLLLGGVAAAYVAASAGALTPAAWLAAAPGRVRDWAASNTAVATTAAATTAVVAVGVGALALGAFAPDEPETVNERAAASQPALPQSPAPPGTPPPSPDPATPAATPPATAPAATPPSTMPTAPPSTPPPTTPTSPQPSTPQPSNPTPTDPEPTEPEPTEPEPTEPEPTDPEPTEPEPPLTSVDISVTEPAVKSVPRDDPFLRHLLAKLGVEVDDSVGVYFVSAGVAGMGSVEDGAGVTLTASTPGARGIVERQLVLCTPARLAARQSCRTDVDRQYEFLVIVDSPGAKARFEVSVPEGHADTDTANNARTIDLPG